MPITNQDVIEAFTTKLKDNLEMGWHKEGINQEEINRLQNAYYDLIKRIQKENEDFLTMRGLDGKDQISAIVNLLNKLEENGSFLYQIEPQTVKDNLINLMRTRKLENAFNVYNPSLDDNYGRHFLYHEKDELYSKHVTAKDMLNEMVCNSLNIFKIMISIESLLTSKEVFDYILETNKLNQQLIIIENLKIYQNELERFFEIERDFEKVMKLSDILDSILRRKSWEKKKDIAKTPLIEDGAIGYIIQKLERVLENDRSEYFPLDVEELAKREKSKLFKNVVFKKILKKYAEHETAQAVLVSCCRESYPKDVGFLSGYIYKEFSEIMSDISFREDTSYRLMFIDKTPLLYLTENLFKEKEEGLDSRFELLNCDFSRDDFILSLNNYKMRIQFRKHEFPEMTDEKMKKMVQESFSEMIEETYVMDGNFSNNFYLRIKSKYREDCLMNLMGDKKPKHKNNRNKI